MLWRSLKGTILGAILTTAIAVTLTLLLFGIHTFGIAETPIDRADSVNHLLKALPLVALASAMVGALGGFAARLPRHGMRMLTSITIVACCAILARIPTATHPQYKGLTKSSCLPFIIAALVGSLCVLIYGIIRTRRSVAKGETL